MAGHLLLGPVLFQDFELPERISWGGQQRLNIHRMPGGRRVIDAMGRDDAPVAWSGVFSGADAGMRARLVDLMRADGTAWPLTWGRFFYTVVVQSFTVSYERANWMPYRIVCAVVRDEVEGLVEDALSIAQSVAGDLLAADGIGSGLDLSGALASLDNLDVGRRGAIGYLAALGGVAAASGSADAALQRANLRAGTATMNSPANVNEAGDAAQNLAQTSQTRGYINRAYANLRNADS